MCLHFCVHLYCAASCVINDDDAIRTRSVVAPNRGLFEVKQFTYTYDVTLLRKLFIKTVTILFSVV